MSYSPEKKSLGLAKMSQSKIKPCGTIKAPKVALPLATTPAALIANFHSLGLVLPNRSQITRHRWKAIIESQNIARRFDAYSEILNWLNFKMARLFSFTWVHSEGSLPEDQIRRVFHDFERNGICIEQLMTAKECAEFRRLPPSFTIYRGCSLSTKNGISWTLCQSVAVNFAKRVKAMGEGKGIVIQATCDKKSVKAYHNDNEHREREIIVFPEDLKINASPIKTFRRLSAYKK